MSTHVALLRAVNVGGTGKIAMADLREFGAALGFKDVRTLLQSGNLVFKSEATAAELESLLEREAKKRLGLETVFFVRTAKEWNSLIAQNPFPEEAARNPARLHVMPLKKAPTAAAVKALEAAIVGPECVRAIGSVLYAVYPDGAGNSRLTNRLIESKLETRCTARNWNTALKLAAMAGGR
jgi:uncharacterized protein (DUF1697 family)